MYLFFVVFILIILPFLSRIAEYYSNKKNYGSEYKAIILKKEYYRGSLNLTYETINKKNKQIVSVNDSLYNLSELGDTIIKLKNSNKCILIKKDTIYKLNFEAP